MRFQGRALDSAALLLSQDDPIAFFALPGRMTHLAPEHASTIDFFPPFGDPTEALEALARISGIEVADTATLPADGRFDMRVRATVEIGDCPRCD